MGCGGLIVLAPTLQKLTSLTGLDLSCNNITLLHDHQTAKLLGHTLASLPLLSRLDLSNNRIKNQLATILGSIAPLKHLELAACGLSDEDLLYLSRSRHVEHIQELDISENNFSRHFEHLVTLLNALCKQIMVLEMEDCALDERHLTHLFLITSKQLAVLRHWNISRNLGPRMPHTLLEDLKAVVAMPYLVSVVVSYPQELGTDVPEGTDNATTQKDYQMHLHQSLNRLCERTNRKPFNVVLVNR